LLDDSFASIVRAIRQGRRIYDNVGKATAFVFAVHVPIIVLALLPALLHWPVILAPVHIVLLELLIDPASSLVFQAEPGSPDLMQRPPRPRTHAPFAPGRLAYALLQGGGLAALLVAGCAVLLAQGDGPAQARTAGFAGLLMGLFLLVLAESSIGFRRRERHNPWLKWMLLGVATCLAAVLGVPPLRTLMGLALPNPWTVMAVGATVLASGAWLAALQMGARGSRLRGLASSAS
jgi:Ca2+-transporting ATPase